MFSSLKLFFPSLNSFVGGRTRAIDLDPLPTHNVETDPERRARTLKHLLKANHANHAIFHHNLERTNTLPNVLCAAYLLDETAEELPVLYEKLSQGLDAWPDIIGGVEDDVWRDTEIGQEEWREFLGKRNQQRAFIDFYEDRMVAEGYEWKQLMNKYLYEGDEPLAYSFAAGSGAALIHLATAYRFNFRDLAIEALAMISCLYQPSLASRFVAREDSATSPATSSALSLLSKVSEDARFADSSASTAEEVLRKHEVAFMEYLNQWTFSTTSESTQHSPDALREALEETQIVSAILAVSQSSPTTTSSASSSVTSTGLTPLLVSGALRTLIILAPSDFVLPLLRQWFLITITTYIVMGRPTLPTMSEQADEGFTWKTAIHDCKSQASAKGQPELLQAIMELKNAAETWGEEVDVKNHKTGQSAPSKLWLNAAKTLLRQVGDD